MSTTSNGTQMPGTEPGIEPLAPLYLAPGFEMLIGRIVQQKIYRVEIGAGRHYRNEAGETFKSITTFLDAVMPPNFFLKKWRESKIEELGSVKAATEFVQATADFGTALHIATAEFCRTGGVDWREHESWAFDYLMTLNPGTHTLHAAVEELRDDFAAILAFIADYEVQILAVEIPVFSKDGYATLIDLVVDMNDKKYTDKTPPEKRKRIFAGINLKSGKKGFYESHLFQLIGERRAFNETYSTLIGHEMVEVFNLAPTNWLTAPNYKLGRHTETITENELEAEFSLYVELGKKRGVLGKPSKNFRMFEGVTRMGENPVANMIVMNYDDLANRRIARREQK